MNLSTKLLCASILAFCSPVMAQSINDLSREGNIGNFDMSGDVIIASYYSEGSKLGFFYQHADGSWISRQSFDIFAGYVAIEGNTAVVVVPEEAQSVHTVFSYIDGQWIKTSQFFSAVSGRNSRARPDISENNIATVSENTVYVYSNSSNEWQLSYQVDMPMGNHEQPDYISAISLHNNTLAVAAMKSSPSNEKQTLHVQLHKRTDNSWAQEAVLSIPVSVEYFNTPALSVFENTLLIGIDSDRVIFYERSDSGQWGLTQQITQDNYTVNFGNAVALNGDQAAVAAFEHVTLYERGGNREWQAVGQLREGLINSGTTLALGDDQAVFNIHGETVVADLLNACVDSDPVGDGWGWSGFFASCQLSVQDGFNFCDYTDSNNNNGWGWNAYNRTSCEPLPR